MALGVENLQRTLDSRELDIDNLEKDLYECRNIIVEQRYKIDGLESELREAKSIVAQEKEEEENIQVRIISMTQRLRSWWGVVVLLILCIAVMLECLISWELLPGLCVQMSKKQT